MPMFDFRCEHCDYEWEGFVHREHHMLCPKCARFADKIFRASANIIPDDIPGGLVVENLSAAPITVYSKSELRAQARARGLVPYVQHRPEQGSDKSKHTSRWV